MEAFSYSVSHDLRAPLRAMHGFAQALLDDYASSLDDIGQDYARRIVRAVSRLDGLILDVLAYSRIGLGDLELRAVNLGGVVAEAASNVEARVERSGGKITIADNLGEVIGHRSTIVQVVSNLLSNATKFVSPGETPEIRVWTEKHQDCDYRSGQRTLRLIVEDKGIGIEPSYLERIFKPFERLHGAESFPGTGIGLAIVKKGIERMGGSVGVDSEPGRGSRFWIELPSA